METVTEKEVNVLKWWHKGLMWVGVSTFLIMFITITFKVARKPFMIK